MKNRNTTYVIFACCCLVLICGCNKKQASQPAPQHAPVRKNMPAKAQAVPRQEVMSSVQSGHTAEPSLDVSSKKDPFKPFVIAQRGARPLHRASVDALPIQQYEVRQFRVAGIIVGLKENSAQVIDPLGKAYVVHKGMLIGSNGGKIIKISASGIEVLELYREDNGKIVRRIIKLTLPKKG